MESYVLPNGLTIKHSNARETAHLYRDIFEDKLYLRHDIDLPNSAVVFDAGANIGLFTLFALENCPSASIYAVEPAPKTFQLLKANTSHHQRVKLYNCGLGSETKQMAFTYFPNLTCGSGYYKEDDLKRIKQIRRSLILADPEKSKVFSGPIGDEFLTYYLGEDLKKETVDTPVQPLSMFIEENQITNVDLLKVDVEGSERDVLLGIRDDHWRLIRQIVVEIHDSKNTLPEIVDMLKAHKYSVDTDFGKFSEIGGKAMVYSRRLLKE